MKILVAGSMVASNRMKKYTSACVKRAKDRAYRIVVGDNPNGIDAVVVEAALEVGVDFACYGVDKTPRNPTVPVDRYFQVSVPGSGFVKFHNRDKKMADIADLGMFIWNGKSRGTKKGYDYMVSQNKEAYLWS